ncbi:hypothetical protein L810_4862 [Burkholderia sp. AU4i]|nr:hypothetical protein L810_4862 [Burkholderia sp. AU4i]QOH32074.1 hypothetical protein C7S14_6379 [Burkholderia cepacia]
MLFWAARQAPDDAWGTAANGSIFSRAAENVFSHLARTGL